MTFQTSEPPSKAQKTKAKLVQAVLDEICAEGTFSAESVARRAGVSPATYYVYYPSKETALAEAFGEALVLLEHTAIDAMSIELLLEKGLDALCTNIVKTTVDYFRKHQLVFRLALAELPKNKSIRDSFRRSERVVLSHYQRVIEMGQRASIVRKESPETLSAALLMLTQGLNNPLVLKNASDELTGLLASSLYAILCA